MSPTKTAVSSWLLRLILVLIFVPHAVGKFLAEDAFSVKFTVPEWEGFALGAIELAAVLGMIVGGLLWGRRRRYGGWLTRLACVGIWLSQVLAIIYAKFPNWLEYRHGSEENVLIIAVAVVLFLLPYVSYLHKHGNGEKGEQTSRLDVR